MSLVVYDSDIDDNRRWLGFPFRDGDVVVSTRSKHGTTWTQMICLQLVLGTDELPEPLGTLSPWVDWMMEPLASLLARLEAQDHRRVFKTHTPLDGVPVDARATYLVVGRHPLDGAASLYHQSDNIDRDRVAELLGEGPPKPRGPRLPEAEWVREWAVDDSSATDWLESPRGVLHHVADAWGRAERGEPVHLVHYTDLLADPHGQVRRIAEVLGIDVGAAEVARVVAASGFETMRAGADQLAPDPGGTLRDRGRFFRSGGAVRGRDLLTDDEQAAFENRCRELAPEVMVDWLLR